MFDAFQTEMFGDKPNMGVLMKEIAFGPGCF
jgi:hypothetical protein